MTATLALPDLFRDAGIRVRVLPGWEQPHSTSQGHYLWRDGFERGDLDDGPSASMWHHTASGGYDPNRLKANMWVGLGAAGTDRLYQSGGGFPVVVIANAYPGQVTSGVGQYSVLEKCWDDERNDELAEGPDDAWAGNRSYWNTEVILDGVGTWIADSVWETLVTAGAVLHRHMGWSQWRAIGHAQHTRRKIDLRDGRHPSAKETMMRFRGHLGLALIDEEDDLMPTFDEWKRGIRDADIDQMVAKGMITAKEGHYFKVTVGLPAENWKPENWTPHLDSEFINLYNAYKVRWALYV